MSKRKKFTSRDEILLAINALVDENLKLQRRIADLERVGGELADCLKLFQAGQTYATQNRYVPAAIHYEKADSMIDKALQSYTGLQKKGYK